MGIGYLLKLLFVGMQPIVVHVLGHGQSKWLNKCSMPPSMLRMKKFCEALVWGELRSHPFQDLNEL